MQAVTELSESSTPVRDFEGCGDRFHFVGRHHRSGVDSFDHVFQGSADLAGRHFRVPLFGVRCVTSVLYVHRLIVQDEFKIKIEKNAELLGSPIKQGELFFCDMDKNGT